MERASLSTARTARIASDDRRRRPAPPITGAIIAREVVSGQCHAPHPSQGCRVSEAYLPIREPIHPLAKQAFAPPCRSRQVCACNGKPLFQTGRRRIVADPGRTVRKRSRPTGRLRAHQKFDRHRGRHLIPECWDAEAPAARPLPAGRGGGRTRRAGAAPPYSGVTWDRRRFRRSRRHRPGFGPRGLRRRSSDPSRRQLARQQPRYPNS
jgi:hypothetical protein